MQSCLGTGAFTATRAWSVSIMTPNRKTYFWFLCHLKYLAALFVLPRIPVQHSPLKQGCCWEHGTCSPSDFDFFSFTVANRPDILRWGHCWPFASLFHTSTLFPSVSGGNGFVPALWLTDSMLYPPALMFPWSTLCGSLARTMQILEDGSFLISCKLSASLMGQVLCNTSLTLLLN